MKAKTFGKVMAASFGAAVLAASVVAVATPAAADPNPITEYRTLAGVGSDTTQDVTNGLANSLKDGAGNRIISSWNARPLAAGDPVTITTKSPATNANCTFNRPDGSGLGRAALKASEEGTAPPPGSIGPNITGCVDFARSSGAPSGTPGTTGNYAWITFGVDAVTWARNANSNLPDTLTFVQLQRIYRCLTTVIGGQAVQPRLIQAGSGTRSFWNTKMGISDAAIANGDFPCLVNLPTVQEHDGTALNGQLNQIAPFSVAQYISQENSGQVVEPGVTVDAVDRRGEAVLGKVRITNAAQGFPVGLYSPRSGAGGFVGPLSTGFLPGIRDVYNVVPVADLGTPVIANTFVGASSAICAKRNIIEAFGFGFRVSTGTQPADLLQQGCGDAYLRANL